MTAWPLSHDGRRNRRVAPGALCVAKGDRREGGADDGALALGSMPGSAATRCQPICSRAHRHWPPAPPATSDLPLYFDPQARMSSLVFAATQGAGVRS